MSAIDELVARHPFFEGMAPLAQRAIAQGASVAQFEAGCAILSMGGRADRFYAILAGRVRIEVHAPEHGAIGVQTLDAGDVLGWSWNFPPYEWQFDAHAIGAVEALAFDATHLRALCDDQPALGYALMKRLALVVSRRLQATRTQLLDLYATKRNG